MCCECFWSVDKLRQSLERQESQHRERSHNPRLSHSDSTTHSPTSSSTSSKHRGNIIGNVNLLHLGVVFCLLLSDLLGTEISCLVHFISQRFIFYTVTLHGHIEPEIFVLILSPTFVHLSQRFIFYTVTLHKFIEPEIQIYLYLKSRLHLFIYLTGVSTIIPYLHIDISYHRVLLNHIFTLSEVSYELFVGRVNTCILFMIA